MSRPHHSPLHRNVALLCLGAFALAGCASKEGRLRQGLMAVGFSAPMARCMAEPMARKLSIAELKRLSALVEQIRDRPQGRFEVEIKALQDPRIVAVTGAALVRCTLP